jgi:hypothetical protein
VAFRTVGTDRVDKPPPQGKRGKERPVVLEQSGYSEGKVVLERVDPSCPQLTSSWVRSRLVRVGALD